jgi:hypothetical protein
MEIDSKACEVRNFRRKKMISIFPLWSFHLYVHVVTFLQHLHMEYIYLMISLIGVPANKVATEPMVPSG